MNRYLNSASKVFAANLALVYASDANAAQKKGQDKPNVVFVLIDDMGWRDLGCFGSDFYETPNIDALADEGMRFTSAYASCHVSSPSRASILTGMYPASLGLTDWLPGRREYDFQRYSTTRVTQDLPHEAETIAETLRSNGYSTALIGKWHLGETGSVPQEHGFDIHIPNGYLRGWPDTYYAPFGMNGYDGKEGDYLTDCMTDEAVKYIRDNSDRPFFLMLSHFAVHDPVEGRADLVAKYTEKLSKMPASDIAPYILEGNPDDSQALSADELKKLLEDPVYATHRILPHNLVKIKQIQDNVNFAAMVESVDESVGRIVSTLDSLGISDNTLLIFYSDNGGMSAANYGNPNRIVPNSQLNKAYSTAVYPLRGGKGWMYEGGLRVPMLVSWPGHIKSGSTCDVPVTGPDFYKTIVAITGSKAPSGAGRDGVDFSPALNGRKMKERPLFWHFPHYSNHGMASPAGAVRDGDYKLIEYYANGTVQLYNLREDPLETFDISKTNPQIVDRLRSLLSSWRKDVNAQMPSENLSYNPVVAAARYMKAAPPRFIPCKVSSAQYGMKGSEFSFLPQDGIYALESKYESFGLREYLDSAQALFVRLRPGCERLLTGIGSASGEEISLLLETAVGAMSLYHATADETFNKFAADTRKAVSSVLRSVHGNEDLTYRWNLLNSMMFEMGGNGRFISSLLSTPDQTSKYVHAYETMLYGNAGGDFNNNLLIATMTDFTLAPGIKFGGGRIQVSVKDDEIRVLLKEYTVPHVYTRYAIEILVPNRKRVSELLLNGQKIPAKVNNRGFVTLSSNWKQGDEIVVKL